MTELKIKWPLIIHYWDTPYLNYINLGNYTMYRMCLVKATIPRFGLFVAIEDRGAFFFGMDDEYLHKDYVAEKLGLGQGDCGQVADFLNAQLLKDCELQGKYSMDCIKDTEPYGKIYEHKLTPWHPEIIGYE